MEECEEEEAGEGYGREEPEVMDRGLEVLEELEVWAEGGDEEWGVGLGGELFLSF